MSGKTRLLAAGTMWMAFALVLVAISVTACSNKQTTSSAEATESSIRPNPVRNKLSITREDHILWNGLQVSERQLAVLLKATRELTPEPELQFQPDVDANYELSAKVLDIIKNSGATKFGFVGNELYSESETPSD